MDLGEKMGHAKAQVLPSLSDDRQVYFLLDLVIALDLSHVPIPSQAKIPASSTISVGLAASCTYTDRLPRLARYGDLFNWPPRQSERSMKDYEAILFSPHCEHALAINHMLSAMHS